METLYCFVARLSRSSSSSSRSTKLQKKMSNVIIIVDRDRCLTEPFRLSDCGQRHPNYKVAHFYPFRLLISNRSSSNFLQSDHQLSARSILLSLK